MTFIWFLISIGVVLGNLLCKESTPRNRLCRSIFFFSAAADGLIELAVLANFTNVHKTIKYTQSTLNRSSKNYFVLKPLIFKEIPHEIRYSLVELGDLVCLGRTLTTYLFFGC